MNVLGSKIEGLGDMIAIALRVHDSEDWSSIGVQRGIFKL